MNKYSLETSKKFEDGAKLVAKVNYFLYYKFNGGLDNYERKLSEFQVGHLSEEFVLAKKILSSSSDAIKSIEKFINGLDPDEFFMFSSWPLFRAVEDKAAVTDIINSRINDILELNTSEQVE